MPHDLTTQVLTDVDGSLLGSTPDASAAELSRSKPGGGPSHSRVVMAHRVVKEAWMEVPKSQSLVM